MKPAISPNGGSALERQKLEKRFEGRLAVNPLLTRKAVSYQGNRNVPGFRWMKYKEGFSQSLVERLLDEFRPSAILDPFAGIGTTPLIAAGRGLRATGIEIMPVAIQIDTCSPNFMIQEANMGPLHRTIFQESLLFENGQITPPTTPGLGIQFDEEVLKAHLIE